MPHDQIWFKPYLKGPPGLGKSTSAQLLSREHGCAYNNCGVFIWTQIVQKIQLMTTFRFVYYEGDCFSQLRNPYIPSGLKFYYEHQRCFRKKLTYDSRPNPIRHKAFVSSTTHIFHNSWKAHSLHPSRLEMWKTQNGKSIRQGFS